jgi:hypothetical protein
VLSLSVLAIALCAGSALGQSADRPTVNVGDQWRFVMYYGIPSTEPNRAWVIKAVTPAGIEGTENGEPLTLTSDLNVLESPRQKESNPKVDAFKLVATATIRGISPKNSQIAGQTDTTYWYAPTARAVVKSVARNPYIGITTVELVEFQFQEERR